jgi:hypothetical protein
MLKRHKVVHGVDSEIKEVHQGQKVNRSAREAHGFEGWWRLTQALSPVNINFVSKT